MLASSQDSCLSSPPSPGPRARPHGIVIDAAVRLPRSRTIPLIRDVAEAATVSRPSAYRSIPAQTDLVHAVVIDVWEIDGVRGASLIKWTGGALLRAALAGIPRKKKET